ncbi:MAG TPA: hypothetical protein DCE18_20190 [Syntrophobacteraceae bacterium]|nr:hypothetical protein [Syntrophobacteraceae bacterium]
MGWQTQVMIPSYWAKSLDSISRISILTHLRIAVGGLMRVRVDEIPEAGRILRLAWAEERFQHFLPPGDPLTIHFAQPLSIDLEIYRRLDHVRVQGNIRAEFRLGCHRCLEDFHWELEQPVDVFLLYRQESPVQVDDGEPELTGEESDQAFFDGEEIDIDVLVAEQVFLALPIKALCSERCRGLCPRCGANLNMEACKCSDSQKESGFAVLQNIRQQLPDKTSG